MDLPRSTFYAAPKDKPSDAELVTEIRAIADAFECYGYRRVGAELRRRGHVVNAKEVRRLMREHDLSPRRRRRFTRTTDSDHEGPIFPFVARDYEVHGPDQLWGEPGSATGSRRLANDLTYVAIATGFVHVAPRHRARTGGAPLARSWTPGRGASWDTRSAAASMPGTPWTHSSARSPCGGRCPGACFIPTAARNTPRSDTARSWPPMASLAP